MHLIIISIFVLVCFFAIENQKNKVKCCGHSTGPGDCTVGLGNGSNLNSSCSISCSIPRWWISEPELQYEYLWPRLIENTIPPVKMITESDRLPLEL